MPLPTSRNATGHPASTPAYLAPLQPWCNPQLRRGVDDGVEVLGGPPPVLFERVHVDAQRRRVERRAALLDHVAVVRRPAYAGARVAALRDADDTRGLPLLTRIALQMRR